MREIIHETLSLHIRAIKMAISYKTQSERKITDAYMSHIKQMKKIKNVPK